MGPDPNDASTRLPNEDTSAFKARVRAIYLEKERAKWRSFDGAKEKQRRDSLATSIDGGAHSDKVMTNEAVDSVVMAMGARESRPPDLGSQDESAEELLDRFRRGNGPRSTTSPTTTLNQGAPANVSVDEVLGTLKDTPSAQAILAAKPDLDRQRLVRLRRILEQDPTAKTDLEALHDRLLEEEQSSGAQSIRDSSRESSRIYTPASSRRSSTSVQEKGRPVGTEAVKKSNKAISNSVLPRTANNSIVGNLSVSPAPETSTALGKRPAATNPSLQNTNSKISLSALVGKIPRKSSVASPKSPDRASSAELSDKGINTGEEERPPKWYRNQARPTRRVREEADVLLLLQRLTSAIGKPDVNVVRDILHELPFRVVNESLLKGNSMLSNGNGLQKLFDVDTMGARRWPYDIRADAQEVYNKWCRKIFETDLLRGIELKSKANKEQGDRNNDRIIKGWHGKVDFHAFGHNELSNGQWFPTQLTTVRDGAHGASQGGICGKTGEGAYSCIMTGHSGYPDEDNGYEVLYCGTDSDDGNVTANTQLLLDNITSGKPVRFIRKSTLKSAWAPEVGYRYDGLYEVSQFEKLAVKENPKAARYRFRLVRCSGQDPIRGGSGPEARPTEQEIHQYKQDKRFR